MATFFDSSTGTILASIAVSALCILTYLVNFMVFKLKKEYRGFHWQMFLVLLLPGLNLIFLMFNLILATVYGSGYRVVKPKKRKAKTVRPVKA